MLGRRKKKETSVIINVLIDCPTYDRFKAYAVKNGFDESTALINVLERGMNYYWVHWYKQQKQNYHVMKEMFEEYKKDNGTLEAIEDQNEQLKKILEERAGTLNDGQQLSVKVKE